MNALLREAAEDGVCLILPGIGDNDERLKQAIELRNRKMIICGQKERMHACNKCEKLLPGTGVNKFRKSNPSFFYIKDIYSQCYSFLFSLAGSFRAVVTDGVTLGHPCCKVHNCTNPLPSNRAHFCNSVADDHRLLKELCVVTGCDKKAEKDHLTCSYKEHRELEEQRKGSGKAFFRLRELLRRQNVLQFPDSMTIDVSDIDIDDDGRDASDPNLKSDKGNQQPKARFARRRTHNEQLVVSCCGMVLARGTMYGAEAISGVKVQFTGL
jgi:hypothetical protein